MPDETTTITTAEPVAPTSPRDLALAAIDRLGWEGEGSEAQPTTETPGGPPEKPSGKPEGGAPEADPLAELAAKVEAKLKSKAVPAPPVAKAPTFDVAAYRANPIAYLESLGLDVVEHADHLFEFASLSKDQRVARAKDAELERFRQAEKARKEQEDAAREEQEIDAAEKSYLAHLESAKDKYPRLMALEPALLVRYTGEVAQMIIDAGEDAGPERLAQLTERYVAKLATTLGAGAQVHKATVVEAGDRNKASAEGRAPETITNHLAAESGSPAERDLSPEGRRAAAMRVAAAHGW